GLALANVQPNYYAALPPRSPTTQQVGAGRSTGVVFDSGDGVSHSVPVFEGYCPPHAVQRFPLAGGDVTMELKKLLQEQGVCLRTTAEMEIVREIKEKCCCVALNYEAELKHRGPSSAEMHYTMPDGQIICLSTERFRAPEILLKPELIGRDQYGMHESVFKSILGSDIDLRRGFLGNIVLSARMFTVILCCWLMHVLCSHLFGTLWWLFREIRTFDLLLM
uniref:Uncharacterized protein n=1 Tax=Myripristis murdjan TaxID=586833 RepID=A0A667Z0R7_9TELE